MACKQEILDMTISSDMICNAVKSFTMSKRLTQAVMKASILNIMYQRMLLNQADLKTRDIEGTAIMVFKRKHAKDPLLQQYLVWMKGIIDAIDKNYLKEVFMFMKNSANEDVIETYRFSLKYNMEENKENERTPTHIKQTTLELLQVINLLGKYEKLSENIEIQIELTYFDTTPKSYEPPGFQASVEKYCMTLPFNCNIHLGTLRTGFHKLKCSGGGETFNGRPFTPIVTEASMEGTEVKEDAFMASTAAVENASVMEEEVVEKHAPHISSPKQVSMKLNMSGITVSDHFHISVSENSVEMTEEHCTCLCQLTMPLDVDVIECLDCKKEYHAPCHGYFSKEDACRADFVCIECDSKDSVLKEIAPLERPLFCRIRLVLYYLDKLGKLPLDILNFLSKDNRNIVIDKLQCFNVLVGKKYSRVNQVALRQVIEKLFVLDDSQML